MRLDEPNSSILQHTTTSRRIRYESKNCVSIESLLQPHIIEGTTSVGRSIQGSIHDYKQKIDAKAEQDR